MNQAYDFFPNQAYLETRAKDYMVYRIDFPDGYGRITHYDILPGVTLLFNDFHTRYGFQREIKRPGMIEIHHCQRGRYECSLPDGQAAYLGPQEFSVSNLGTPPHNFSFTLGEYYGIGLILEVETACHSIDAILGPGEINLCSILPRLFFNGQLLLLRADPKIQHIFSQFYEIPPRGRRAYFKLKVLELLLCLESREDYAFSRPKRCLCRDAARRIQEIEHRMAENLEDRHSLQELAQQYQISTTTLKKNFRMVYGDSPYAHLKRLRMEAAAMLLHTTHKPVHEIAQEVGYQNPSKFSSAFASIYNMSPSKYKKGAIVK